MLTEIIRERIEQIKADIKEFTILALEAKTERDKMKYGYLVAEFKDTLETTNRALKQSEACDKKREQIKKMMNDDTTAIEDIMKIVFNLMKCGE